MSGGPDPLYVRARTALLDAADALAEQLDALVLVGAQAIYLHTGRAEFAVAEYTTDADFCVAPEVLTDEPLLPGLLEARGFSLGQHPGALSAVVTAEAVSQIAPLFGDSQAPGIGMAVRAARLSADADVVSASFTALVADLLAAISRTGMANQSAFAGSAISRRMPG